MGFSLIVHDNRTEFFLPWILIANYIKPRYYLKNIIWRINSQKMCQLFLNSGYALFEKELINK